MKKRITCAALAVFMALSGLFGSFAFAADTPSSWAAESVDAAINAGLVPENLQSAYTQPITRAEFCALAVALYESAAGEEISGRGKFDDTNDVNVEKMASLGVVYGISDGVFAPDRKLTRQEAAVILARLAEAMGDPLPQSHVYFNDNRDIDSWALEAVGQVKSIGIMSGTIDYSFSPKANYTREQSILTIQRLDEARFFRCEIKTTTNVTWKAPDSKYYAVYSFERPVCTGDTPLADAINAEYDRMEKEFVTAEEGPDGPAAFYTNSENGRDYIASIAPGDGLFYSHEVSTSKSYTGRGVLSFCTRYYYDPVYAVHPSSSMSCLNFDRETGKILRIDDVLNVTESSVADALYNEMLKGNLYSGGASVKNSSIELFSDQLKDASNIDVPFYFAADGIHVFYHEYTISYSAGEFKLIIPYSRTDLIRAPYAG